MGIDIGEVGCVASEMSEQLLSLLGWVEVEHPTWVASLLEDTGAARFIGIEWVGSL